ncbi:hypothetical protein ES332_D06G106900v1 [Gossypium tomentosum]|uniref:Uncharacterized protein n=1 Tax=Gossypium tomentosum TaxID=34277 RepID=A0A5D2KJI4_GOSTO|nr:hypothetical protein ES332_D06G106900v1 [Gossypium tomentosum]
MDFQEQFFKERIKFIHEARDKKEESFEKMQHQEREKVQQSNPNPSNAEGYKCRKKRLDSCQFFPLIWINTQAELESFKMEYANTRLECNAADERANILASKVIGLEEKASEHLWLNLMVYQSHLIHSLSSFNFLRHLKLKGVAVLGFPTLIRVVVYILFICLVFLF